MQHREGHFQGAGAVELYCQSWQPDGKVTAAVCFVHGHGDHSSRHGNLTAFLSENGFSLYAFDLRGHGRSPGKRGHIDGWGQLREDLRAFLRLAACRGAENPISHPPRGE